MKIFHLLFLGLFLIYLSPAFAQVSNGDKADLTLYDPSGKKVSLASQLKGKVTVIDLWATTCHYCLVEVPYELELMRKLGNRRDLQFIMISTDEAPLHREWISAIHEHFTDKASRRVVGKHFTTLKYWNSEVVNKFQLMGIPHFMIVGRDGRYTDINAPWPSGFHCNVTLYDKIRDALAGKPYPRIKVLKDKGKSAEQRLALRLIKKEAWALVGEDGYVNSLGFPEDYHWLSTHFKGKVKVFNFQHQFSPRIAKKITGKTDLDEFPYYYLFHYGKKVDEFLSDEPAVLAKRIANQMKTESRK